MRSELIKFQTILRHNIIDMFSKQSDNGDDYKKKEDISVVVENRPTCKHREDSHIA